MIRTVGCHCRDIAVSQTMDIYRTYRSRFVGEIEPALNAIGDYYSFDRNSLRLLNAGQNVLYSLSDGKDDYVLRINLEKARSMSLLKSEMAWLDLLHSKGLPVVRPVPSKRNNYVESIGHIGGEYTVALFKQVDGAGLNDGHISNDLFYQIGKWQAMMHDMAIRFSHDKAYSGRDTWFEGHFFRSCQETLEILQQDTLRKKLSALTEHLISSHRANSRYYLIHADLDFTNILIKGKDITIIDFDNLEYNTLAADIANTLYGCCINVKPARKEKVLEFWKHYTRGYKATTDITIPGRDELIAAIEFRDMTTYLNYMKMLDMDSADKKIRADFESWRVKIELGERQVELARMVNEIMTNQEN